MITRLYTQDEVYRLATSAVMALMNLDNGTAGYDSIQEDEMKRIKRRVIVNGKEHWITGADEQSAMDAYMRLCMEEGIVAPPIASIGQNGSSPVPTFGEYIKEYVRTFKSKQQTTTVINRDRIIRNHVLPKFGETPINGITTGDIQKWFDQLAQTYSRETILKIKNIVSPAFDAAVEDGLIIRNPIKSSRIEIGGAETIHHKALPKEKMEEIRSKLWALELREKRMLAILCSTGMRFEEVLGLRWEDIDIDRKSISIDRAVVHPTRNLPEVKETKTASSKRIVPLPRILEKNLIPYGKRGFILASFSDPTMETPLSYSEARRIFQRIRKDFDIPDYSAHDFRDTCATEWREQGIPTDVIAKLLGHTKS